MLKEIKNYLQENLGILAEEFLKERHPDIYEFLNNLEEYELSEENNLLLEGEDYPYFFVVEVLRNVLDEKCCDIKYDDYEYPLVRIEAASLDTYFRTGKRILVDSDYYNTEFVLEDMKKEYDRWISFRKNEGKIKLVSPACLK